MTTKNIEKLAKAIIKNHNVLGPKVWDEFLGFNIPEVINSKEIYDFKLKHNCSISFNMFGLMYIFTKTTEYKVEIYKGKICVSKFNL